MNNSRYFIITWWDSISFEEKYPLMKEFAFIYAYVTIECDYIVVESKNDKDLAKMSLIYPDAYDFLIKRESLPVTLSYENLFLDFVNNRLGDACVSRKEEIIGNIGNAPSNKWFPYTYFKRSPLCFVEHNDPENQMIKVVGL